MNSTVTFGIVDCLGYLVCKTCNDAGPGGRVDAHVWCAPHADDPCDKCGKVLRRSLVGSRVRTTFDTTGVVVGVVPSGHYGSPPVLAVMTENGNSWVAGVRELVPVESVAAVLGA